MTEQGLAQYVCKNEPEELARAVHAQQYTPVQAQCWPDTVLDNQFELTRQEAPPSAL